MPDEPTTAPEGRPTPPRPLADAPADDRRARVERRRERRFVLTDRRTGFDRRREYPVTGRLRDRPALLAGVLVAVNLLSAADFFLTQAELQAGIAIEGNPLLAALFEGGPLSAWLFKTTVVLAVTLVIWHQRHRRPILLVALAAFGIYLAVIGYHVAGIMRTIGI